MMTGHQWMITVLCAALFGALCVLPHAWFRWDAGGAFQGIEFQPTDAEVHYTARVQEIRDGAAFAANVYFDGPKTQPYLFPPLPELVISTLGLFIGLDAPRSILFSQFLFGVALWIIVTGFLTALTRRFAVSLFAVAVLFLASPLFPWPQMLVRVLGGTAGGIEFLPFSRPVNPQWSLTLFFGALWAFLHWTRTRSRFALVVAGALTLASVYSYIYVWTVLGVVFAAFGVRALFARDGQAIRHLLALASGILVGAAPYLWNVWQASHHPWYAETAARNGLFPTHEPVFSVTLLLLIVLVFFARRLFQKESFFIFSLVAALIVALNQQLVTGTALAPPHYHWYFVKPLFLLFAVSVVGMVMERFIRQRHALRRALPWAWGIGLVSLFAFALAYQRAAYDASRPFWMGLQRTGPVLVFLRESGVRPGTIVYARDTLRNFVSVYTSADVAWATDALLYLSPDTRARDAYFFDLWVDGVSADDAAATFFTARRNELVSRIHSIAYRERTGSYGGAPDEEIREQVDAYRAFLALSDEGRIARVPMDLVVLAQDLPPTPATDFIASQGELLFQNNDYEVFRLPRVRD